MLGSVRAYARRRGCTHRAVQKAIEGGRIGAAYDPTRKLLDFDLADKLWAANTDQTKPLNTVSGHPKHRREPGAPPVPLPERKAEHSPEAPQAPAPEAVNVPDPAPEESLSYVKARTARETYSALLAKQQYLERQRRLIPKEEVLTAVFNATRRARDMLLGIPDRVAPTLVGLTDTFDIHRILTEELRRVCDDLGSPERYTARR